MTRYTLDEIRDEAVVMARRVLAYPVSVDGDPERLAMLYLELDKAAREGHVPRAWTPFGAEQEAK